MLTVVYRSHDSRTQAHAALLQTQDTSQFFEEQSAARRMLAVLCDAQAALELWEFAKIRGYRCFGGPYNKDPTI